MLTSQFSFSQTYGYFEISAKLPGNGPGLWPAFWLLPTKDGAWRPEIDVMEVITTDTTSLWQFSHPSDSSYDRYFNTKVPDMSSGFHRYGVDWEADKLTFYFDGQVTGTAPTAPDMNSPMYMIVNLAVGGSWGGPPSASTTFPASLQIDYIRAYQANTAPTFTNLAISGPQSAGEGASGSSPFTYTVTRTGNLSGATTVSWAVTGSGASPANAQDFSGGALPGGSLSFAANQSTATFTVNVAGDTTVEPDEGFTVTLSNAVGGTITTAAASSVILNDDGGSGPTVSLSPGSIAQPEGTGGTTYFVFTVQRTGVVTGPSTVQFAVSGSGANPAAASDFNGNALPSGTVWFGGGETSKQIWIAVNGDSTSESDETFTVTLSNPSSAAIGTATAGGVIQNDDGGAPQGASLAIGPASVSHPEGNSGATAFAFTVTRSGDLSGASSASWGVTGSGANAANAADFTGGVLPSGTVSFAAGQSSATVTVNVAGDTTTEPDEGFTVTLSNPSGATVSTAAAQGVIQNDDAAQGASLAIGPASVSHAEGASGSTAFVYTVTRTGDLSGTASVSWAVAGSGSNPANAADFTGNALPSGSVNFAAGQSSATITVNVAGDAAVESDETFTVTLSNATGATLSTPTAQGLIQNDDAATTGRTVSIGPAALQVVEGNTDDAYFVYNVTRSGDLSGPTVIDWVVTGNGAHPVDGSDFVGGLPSGRVWFGGGESQKSVWLQVHGDTVQESDETFSIQLVNPNGATIVTGQAMGTILNDDGVTVN